LHSDREDCGRRALVERAGVRLSYFELGSGYARERHAHERAGVVLVVDGRFEATGGRYSVNALPGCAGILPSGFAHGERAGHAGARCVLIEPTRADFRRTLDPASPGQLRSAALVTLGRRLWNRIHHGEAWHALDEIHELLLYLRVPSAERDPLPSHRAPTWLHRVVEILRDGGEPRDGAALAREVGISREHLARTFPRYTGQTVTEFRRRVRVARTAAALRHSSLPLAAVAARFGFSDQSHMTRTFRAYFGVTPSDYRSDR
jgi:AraC family transcriptional regulator